MDRLSIILTSMTGAVLTGAIVIAFFSMGIYNWGAVLIAVGLGWTLSWPAAWIISRRIKRNDPAFDHKRRAKGTTREV